MPYDLDAVERGYGECVANVNDHHVTLRYRADLDGRAMHAIRRALVGVPTIGDGSRMPDSEQVISELVRILLPCSDEIPEHERGWDITRGGAPVPVNVEELERLDFHLPVLFLTAIMADIRNPNRKRPSLGGSRVGAVSEPIAFPTSTGSSATPNGQASLSGPSPASPTIAGTGPVGASGYGA